MQCERVSNRCVTLLSTFVGCLADPEVEARTVATKNLVRSQKAREGEDDDDDEDEDDSVTSGGVGEGEYESRMERMVSRGSLP